MLYLIFDYRCWNNKYLFIYLFKITHEKLCKIIERKKMKIWRNFFFLSLAKQFLDPDPHQNVLARHIALKA